MEDPQTPEELARIHEQLWQTVLQFGNFSASQERNRIARDLHDSLGQALTALNIQLQTAVKLWQLDPGRAEQFLAEAQRLGSTAVQEVRQTVRTLRLDCPDDQSIDTLITSLVESFHRSTGVLPTVKLNLVAPMPPEVVTPVYRIIQEGLNNICKYAQATEVNVQLSTTPTSLGLIIEDNGRGFDLEQAVTGFGLRGMQERVSLLRGRFQIETEPGAGCRIRVVMPLRVLSLHDSQELVPPPVNPEADASRYPQGVASPAPAMASPAPTMLAEDNGRIGGGESQSALAEENGKVGVKEPQVDAQEFTPVSEDDREAPPASPLPLMSEPEMGNLQAVVSPDLDETLLPAALDELDDPAIAPSDLDETLLPTALDETGGYQEIAPPDLDETTFPAAWDETGENYPAIASPDLDETPVPGLVLMSAQVDRLTQILLEAVGPIAPILLQQALAQAQQPDDVIDQLAVYFPAQRREHFERQMQAVLRQVTFPAPSVSQPGAQASPTFGAPIPASPSSGGHSSALNAELTHYCEQELMALIGPVAHFLIQDALSTPNLSLEELVDRLAVNISNPQKATQFKQRILSYAS